MYTKRFTKKVLIIETDLILRATNKESSNHNLSKMELLTHRWICKPNKASNSQGCSSLDSFTVSQMQSELPQEHSAAMSNPEVRAIHKVHEKQQELLPGSLHNVEHAKTAFPTRLPGHWKINDLESSNPVITFSIIKKFLLIQKYF